MVSPAYRSVWPGATVSSSYSHDRSSTHDVTPGSVSVRQCHQSEWLAFEAGCNSAPLNEVRETEPHAIEQDAGTEH